MNEIINRVWANDGASGQGSPYSLMIMLVIFAVIFYFTIFRPQQNRNKNHKKLINSISRGDEILTNGGLIGKVVKVTETGYIFIVLNPKVSDSNNEVLIRKDCITAILPKGTMKAI